MKKLFTIGIVAALIATTSLSQTKELNLSFDREFIFSEDTTSKTEIDIDSDGVSEFRITGWFNHQYGVESAIEIVSFQNYGLENNFCGYLTECATSSSNYQYEDVYGYIYTSNYTNDCGDVFHGQKSFPLSFYSDGEQMFGALYVDYTSTHINIDRLVYSPSEFDCTSDLGIQTQYQSVSGPVKYYDLLGNEVKQFGSGIYLVIDDQGHIHKEWHSN